APLCCLDSKNQPDIALLARIHATLRMLEPNVQLDPAGRPTADIARLPHGRVMSPQVVAPVRVIHELLAERLACGGGDLGANMGTHHSSPPYWLPGTESRIDSPPDGTQ